MSDGPGHLIERAAARLREGMRGQEPPPAVPAGSSPVNGTGLRTNTPAFRPLSLPGTAAGNAATVARQTQADAPPAALADANADAMTAPDSDALVLPKRSNADPMRPVSAPPAPDSTQPPAPMSKPAAPPPRPVLPHPPARADIGTAQPTSGRQALPTVQLDALERAGMVVARTTRTRISEEYRIAIGRILRVLHEATNIDAARHLLMVTSARPGEGKSFTALNLAGSIAQNGTDAVMLVDVDPKIRPISEQLGLGDVSGFLDLVADPSLRPEDLIRSTALPSLTFLPIGTRLGGAAQTAGGTASTRPIMPTVTRLSRRFPKHLIILDAPPCLSTSDPHTLAPHVGQVVLVVEAERTQRSEVEAAADLVRVCPNITLLLNKVKMTSSHTFGAYDYFGSYT